MIHLTLPYNPEDIHSLFEDVTERNLFQHTMSIPFFPTRTLFSSKNDLTTHLHWPKTDLENQKKKTNQHYATMQQQKLTQHSILPFIQN